MSEENNPRLKKKDKPAFLLVLLVLTCLSLASSLFGVATNLVKGPASNEELRAKEVEAFKPLIEAKKSIKDDNTQKAYDISENLIRYGVEKNRFIHTQVFWQYHALLLLVIAVGAGALFFMFKLKKLGFHLYIIYCILALGITFVVFPSEFRSNLETYGALFISGLFIFLYGLNLKHFVNQDAPDDSGFEYNN